MLIIDETKETVKNLSLDDLSGKDIEIQGSIKIKGSRGPINQADKDIMDSVKTEDKDAQLILG